MVRKILVGIAIVAAPAALLAAKDNEKPDKLICKKVFETGSRVVTGRICKTKAEWDDERRAAAEIYRKIDDPNWQPSLGGK